MVEELPHLPDIERLSPRVIRILGGNPNKFTLQGTNTHLIGTGPKRLLIDTGQGEAIWQHSLSQVLAAENASLEAVLLTHYHADHVGGIAHVQALQPGVPIWKHDPSPGQVALPDGHTFHVPGASLRAVHTPGHSADHMAFVLEDEDALFTGDAVLGHGSAVFEDLASYVASLHRMLPLFRGRAYPSHGAVVDDGPAKVRDYIAHRAQREREALDVLASRSHDPWWTSRDMVEVVYRAYPEAYWGPAEGSLKLVLGKLEAEGSVRQREGDGKWALVGRAAL